MMQELVNVVVMSEGCPSEWKRSSIVRLYKDEAPPPQSWQVITGGGNYRGR